MTHAMFPERHRPAMIKFLYALVAQADLPVSDRAQDAARQLCCRRGLARYSPMHRRWTITDLGIAEYNKVIA